AATGRSAIAVVQQDGTDAVELRDIVVRLPHGKPLVEATAVTIAAGERVLIAGPSGIGKSTLFRAIAGIWPFGSGLVVVPRQARMMFLPQRPYFPIATLAAAVTYPAPAGCFDHDQLAAAITAAGLP